MLFMLPIMPCIVLYSNIAIKSIRVLIYDASNNLIDVFQYILNALSEHIKPFNYIQCVLKDMPNLLLENFNLILALYASIMQA